jgi:hypothetical protein
VDARRGQGHVHTPSQGILIATNVNPPGNGKGGQGVEHGSGAEVKVGGFEGKD